MVVCKGTVQALFCYWPATSAVYTTKVAMWPTATLLMLGKEVIHSDVRFNQQVQETMYFSRCCKQKNDTDWKPGWTCAERCVFQIFSKKYMSKKNTGIPNFQLVDIVFLCVFQLLCFCRYCVFFTGNISSCKMNTLHREVCMFWKKRKTTTYNENLCILQMHNMFGLLWFSLLNLYK